MDEINIIEEKFTRCPKCRSFSVKSTELNYKERLKQHFISVSAHQCSNCGYRFAEYGSISDALKVYLVSLFNRIERKWLLFVVPLAIISILVAVVIIPWDSNLGLNEEKESNVFVSTEKNIEDNSKNDKKASNNTESSNEQVETSQDNPPDDKGNIDIQPKDSQAVNGDQEEKKEIQDNKDVSPTPEITGEIVLGNSNRFGVNWVSVSNGVRITRLSIGPLKAAGLKVGDIITEVNENKVSNGTNIERMRNQIFHGQRSEAMLKIVRDNSTLIFRLVKYKTKEENKNIESPPAVSSSVSTSKNEDAVLSVKVCDSKNIKVRKSAPDTVSSANRWRFFKRNITISRETNQRVYIAGNSKGTAPWAVDDHLIVNGKLFRGISTDLYSINSGILPKNTRLTPMDITELVPVGKQIPLRIELSDDGRYWANTDIYVVIK